MWQNSMWSCISVIKHKTRQTNLHDWWAAATQCLLSSLINDMNEWTGGEAVDTSADWFTDVPATTTVYIHFYGSLNTSAVIAPSIEFALVNKIIKVSYVSCLHSCSSSCAHVRSGDYHGQSHSLLQSPLNTGLSPSWCVDRLGILLGAG